jgi:hypothetical protein
MTCPESFDALIAMTAARNGFTILTKKRCRFSADR